MSIRTNNAQALIDQLIGVAPATLDTLQEIAAAINNDPNFASSISPDSKPDILMLAGM